MSKKTSSSNYQFRQGLQFQADRPDFIKKLLLTTGSGATDEDQARERRQDSAVDDELPTIVRLDSDISQAELQAHFETSKPVSVASGNDDSSDKIKAKSKEKDSKKKESSEEPKGSRSSIGSHSKKRKMGKSLSSIGPVVTHPSDAKQQRPKKVKNLLSFDDDELD